jgi:predicted ATPase
MSTANRPACGRDAATGMIGRQRERAELGRRLEQAQLGRGQLVLLTGEPGIGKTRLADQLARDAAAGGALVVWGACWEGGGAPAYFPWIQILRGCASQCAPEALAALMRNSAPPVAAFVGEVLSRAAAAAATPAALAGLDNELSSDRFQLFDAVSTFLAAASASRPLVVIVDDAHAADIASLLLLRFIARGLREHRLLLVVTYRDTEVRRDAQLSGLMADLGR